jgi:hypothetical protein
MDQMCGLRPEYPVLARRLFPKAKIDFSHGGSEQKVAYLGYDYAVCVTETGKSIIEMDCIL